MTRSAPAPTDPSPTGGPPPWRSLRAPVLVGLLVVVATLVTLLVTAAPTGRLDPEAAGPDGARAVAAITERLGADVERVRTSRAAVAALDDALAGGPADPGGAVLVVVEPELLLPSSLETLAERPDGAALVLVEPTDDALAALVPGVEAVAPVEQQPLQPACDLPAAERAGVASAGGLRFRVGSDAAGPAVSCYARGGLGTVVRVDPAGAAPVTLLGSGELLTNEGLDDEGDAALALGLLEGAGTVVWLLPDPLLELEGGDDGTSSVADLLPPAVGWALLQVAVAVVLLALARARRVGAGVAEPLPVVVRAAEVVEGRGRLYRAGRTRGVAADALRDAARARVLPLLGLPSRARREEVVETAAARTGDEPGRVAGLLYGAPPSDDTGLVRLADALDDLERRLRAALPRPHRPTEGPRR